MRTTTGAYPYSKASVASFATYYNLQVFSQPVSQQDPQGRGFYLEPILELSDFRKELRVFDGNGCSIGNDCETLEFLFAQWSPPEHCDHAEQFRLELQRVVGK
jgi:hypothetical protein